MSKLTKWFNPREWVEDNRSSMAPISKSFNSTLLEPFYDFHQELDNLFNNFYNTLPMPRATFNNLNLVPSLDVVEDENNFKVELEMPGVDEKDIKVCIDNQTLIIKASKEISKKDEGKNYILKEISYGTYERRILLPDNANTEHAESTFKKGMLWVNIPKTATDKSKVRELDVKNAAAVAVHT